MIDEQKVIGMLQAKALSCLDADENKELQDFIDEGHVFPWDELGKFQNVASLLPLALQLELPDAELKDRVALKLIKLSEQLRIQKILEEDKFEVEEEADENIDEFTNIQEPFVEPPIEIENEEPVVEDNLVDQLNPEETTFNLDEVVLPGYESVETPNTDAEESLTIESPFETLIDESEIDYPQVEEVEISEVLNEPEIPHYENTAQLVGEEYSESKPAEESEDSNKQLDLTKKSVAEKMFRAIEQDFDSLKFQFEESERKTTRGLLIAYVIIAVLLALLIFSFFKFSSDINTLNNEVKDLKKKVSSSLYDEQKSNPDYHFFS
ncbi:MAG: hypothetical protein IPI19_13010 [Ignavibacteriales bacterium]|nr:hypothetical protein [Ignavibacteriales bacterium]